MAKKFFVMGSVSAFLAVVLGAFAAHVLKDMLTPDLFNIWEVGVRYHFYHALGLFVVAWAMSQWPGVNFTAAGWLFVAGTIIFSGSLYILSVTGMRWIGAITPVGGICFLGGWFWLAWTMWRSQ